VCRAENNNNHNDGKIINAHGTRNAAACIIYKLHRINASAIDDSDTHSRRATQCAYRIICVCGLVVMRLFSSINHRIDLGGSILQFVLFERRKKLKLYISPTSVLTTRRIRQLIYEHLQQRIFKHNI